jgi:hypothetical protein
MSTMPTTMMVIDISIMPPVSDSPSISMARLTVSLAA